MELKDIDRALKRPFPVSQISWRTGATSKDKTRGIALAYIDARDVMRRFDDVFGLNWQNRYSHAEGKTICEIGVKLDGEWVWRAGGAGDTDIEAEKGAISDAFKRSAVLWGVGRYLYELPNSWVEIDQYKALKTTPNLPSWATPEGFDALMAKRDGQQPVKEDQVEKDTSPKATAQRIAAGVDAGDADGAADAMSGWEKARLDAVWALLDSDTQDKLTAAWPNGEAA